MCFSVCVSSRMGVPESLYYPASMHLFLHVPNLCVLVPVHHCPWMYLSICILCLSFFNQMCVFPCLSVHVAMCLSVWASNEPLCSNACASISLCALLNFCVFLILYMSFNLCMLFSLYVFLSHCASLNLYSLNFYMSLHLCMWSLVCAWLVWVPMSLFVPVSVCSYLFTSPSLCMSLNLSDPV